MDPNRVFKLNVEADTDMVEAIGDILTNEVECELSHMERELASGDLGQRAIETREARSQHLLNKVAKYEQSLRQEAVRAAREVPACRVRGGLCQVGSLGPR